MAYQGGNNGSGKPNVVLAPGLLPYINADDLCKDPVFKSLKRHQKKGVRGAGSFGELEAIAWQRTRDSYFIPGE
jgi:hypothetical protein